MKVLVALDETECSEIIIDHVANHPWCGDVQFKLINVVEMVSPQYPMSSSILQPMVESQLGVMKLRDAALSRCAKEIKARVLQNPVTTEVLLGDPADQILEEAKNWQADLIIVGTHSRRGFEHFILGSVAEKVVRCAPCSVDVVKRSPNSQTGTQNCESSAV